MSYRKIRILIVDDDPAVREFLKGALEKGYDLELASNADEAWELLFFFGEPFELIIMDIVMPGTNGIELLKRLREINPIIPVLIITAHSTHERAKQACNFKINGYIEKPFDIKELQEKIRDITEGNKNTFADMVHPWPLLSHTGGKNSRLFHPSTVRCLHEIHKHFHSTFTIDNLASACSISKHHLCKIFKRDCSMTIGDYIRKIRMEVVKRLLKNSAYTVSYIQESTGYKSRTHFFNTFKKTTGMSPLEFRKMAKIHKKDTLQIQK